MKSVDDLPTVDVLKQRIQAVAMLDAILCDEPEYRYYSFDRNWSDEAMLGTINNGSGDDVFLVFTSEGCFIKEFSHEYQSANQTPDEAYALVPAELQMFTVEPSFSPEFLTACYWRLKEGAGWHTHRRSKTFEAGPNELLLGLDGSADTYWTYVTDYLEIDVSRSAISCIFRNERLTPKLAIDLGFKGKFQTLSKDANAIGYPI